VSTMEQDLLQCFPDKPPRMQERLAEIIDILSEDGRRTLSAISRDLELPVSTAYEYMKLIRNRLYQQTVFSPNLDAIPRPHFRCPECKSHNTEPQMLHNPVTDRDKITGARCHDCGCDIRRGQLSPTLIKKMEG